MDFVLAPQAPDDAIAAARLAAARAGVAAAPSRGAARAAWSRVGLAEAVEREPTGHRPPAGHDVALPPRSTRGATRA